MLLKACSWRLLYKGGSRLHTWVHGAAVKPSSSRLRAVPSCLGFFLCRIASCFVTRVTLPNTLCDTCTAVLPYRRFGGQSFYTCDRITMCPLQKKMMAKELMSQVGGTAQHWAVQCVILHTCTVCIFVCTEHNVITDRFGLRHKPFCHTCLWYQRHPSCAVVSICRSHILALAEGDRLGGRLPPPGVGGAGATAGEPG